jgi:hypothetical protein
MPFASDYNPVTPYFAVVTAGQTQIPAGAVTFSVTVVSGAAVVNGSAPIWAPTQIESHIGTPVLLNVGATGSNVVVFYQK